MAIARYGFILLLASALLPASASENDPPKVVVKGMRDSSTVVVEGVRDPSRWFRIESQNLIVYSDNDQELMGAQPNGEVMAKAIDAWRRGHDVAAFARAAALAYAWLGDAADAHQTFVTLLRNTRDPDNAAWAASWLARLEKGVPRDELLAALRREHGLPSGLVSR